MDEEARQFLEHCWKVVNALGIENPREAMAARTGWGFKVAGALCYRDSVVQIVAEKPPSKKILVKKRETGVPVVVTDETGHPIRWHSEYILIARHVRAVAKEIDETPPAA